MESLLILIVAGVPVAVSRFRSSWEIGSCGGSFCPHPFRVKNKRKEIGKNKLARRLISSVQSEIPHPCQKFSSINRSEVLLRLCREGSFTAPS